MVFYDHTDKCGAASGEKEETTILFGVSRLSLRLLQTHLLKKVSPTPSEGGRSNRKLLPLDKISWNTWKTCGLRWGQGDCSAVTLMDKTDSTLGEINGEIPHWLSSSEWAEEQEEGNRASSWEVLKCSAIKWAQRKLVR